MGRIRPARAGEAPTITEVVLRAKAHWGYDDVWIERWRAELAVTETHISAGGVFVYVDDDEIVGMSQIFIAGESAELDKLFVDPRAMGRGCGKCLFMHAVKYARDAGCTIMTLESDPNAEAFYTRLGAVRVSACESAIAGRFVPRMVVDLREKSAANVID